MIFYHLSYRNYQYIMCFLTNINYERFNNEGIKCYNIYDIYGIIIARLIFLHTPYFKS